MTLRGFTDKFNICLLKIIPKTKFFLKLRVEKSKMIQKNEKVKEDKQNELLY